jgi:hypothetical protein
MPLFKDLKVVEVGRVVKALEVKRVVSAYQNQLQLL